MEFVDGKNKHPITKKYNYVRILEIKKHALTTTFSFSFKIPQTCLQAFIIFLTIEVYRPKNAFFNKMLRYQKKCDALFYCLRLCAKLNQSHIPKYSKEVFHFLNIKLVIEAEFILLFCVVLFGRRVI